MNRPAAAPIQSISSTSRGFQTARAAALRRRPTNSTPPSCNINAVLGSPRSPTWLALGHGAIAATGVLLLAYAAVTFAIPGMPQVALGLFVLAALGGITIFVRYHLKYLPVPIPFVLGHGLLALTAVGLLWMSIYQVG